MVRTYLFDIQFYFTGLGISKVPSLSRLIFSEYVRYAIGGPTTLGKYRYICQWLILSCCIQLQMILSLG